MKENGESTYDVEPTIMQRRAVDNILSGKFKSKGAAMRAAGYSMRTSTRPGNGLLKKKGVQKYLAQLDKESRMTSGKSLKKKVMDVYFGGLDATKLVGKDAVEHPDHPTRKLFADKMMEFFGWSEQQKIPTQMNQYNFFSTSKEEQDEFNERFKKFIRQNPVGSSSAGYEKTREQ